MMATILIPAAIISAAPAYAQNADQILQRTRDLYQNLKSYSDAGVVVNEYAADIKDRHTFTTVFQRAPRHFLLEFHKQGGDQFVIWGNPDTFHTWWKTTGQQYDFPTRTTLPRSLTRGKTLPERRLKSRRFCTARHSWGATSTISRTWNWTARRSSAGGAATG